MHHCLESNFSKITQKLTIESAAIQCSPLRMRAIKRTYQMVCQNRSERCF